MKKRAGARDNLMKMGVTGSTSPYRTCMDAIVN